MKILMLLANPFKPDDRVNNEAISLINAGNDVKILAWDREGIFPRKEKLNKIVIKRIKLKTGYNNRGIIIPMIIFEFLILLNALFTRRFDVIHCHDLDTLIPGLIVAKIRRKKIVYDAHEDYPGQAESLFPRWTVKLLYFIEKKGVQHVDGFVTPHPTLLDKFGKIVGKSALVMNCKSLSRGESAKKDEIDRLKGKLGLKNRFILMFVGGCTRYRFVAETVASLIKKPIPSATFLILGRFIDETGDMIMKLKDERKVMVLPSVALEVLPLYVQLGDLFHCYQNPSNPNYRIAIPNKLFDAMTGGKPVIVAKGNACEEIVKKYNCGFVLEYGDIDALRETISWSANHPDELKKMGQNGRHAVEQEYNWEEMGSRLVKLYSSLAKNEA